jgi:hypothetical protein
MTVSNVRFNGACQILAVLLAGSTVLLFTLLSRYPIYVPDYATKHDVKNAQQVVNLLTIIVAGFLAVYLQYCLGSVLLESFKTLPLTSQAHQRG